MPLWLTNGNSCATIFGMATVTVEAHQCQRCRWIWLPRYKDVGTRPKVCPKCKSYVWDKPRRDLVASPGSNGGDPGNPPSAD